jgi:hypothetical protein
MGIRCLPFHSLFVTNPVVMTLKVSLPVRALRLSPDGFTASDPDALRPAHFVGEAVSSLPIKGVADGPISLMALSLRAPRAAQRWHVTASGHAQFAQGPPRITTAEQRIGPLVEAVAAALVGAGPTPPACASTTTTGIPARTAVAAAVRPANPAPITTTRSLPSL